MKMKYIKVLLTVLIILTVSFIFSQSMLPPEKSSAESDKVGDIVADIIPPETETGGFVQRNLRKLAHFVEFFALGAEVSLLVIAVLRSWKYAVLSLPSSALVALLDETIQIFSNRGPAVTDVWIDVLGFSAASVIIYTVYLAVSLILRKIKN